jgi:hypothetical protein
VNIGGQLQNELTLTVLSSPINYQIKVLTSAAAYVPGYTIILQLYRTVRTSLIHLVFDRMPLLKAIGGRRAFAIF